MDKQNKKKHDREKSNKLKEKKRENWCAEKLIVLKKRNRIRRL